MPILLLPTPLFKLSYSQELHRCTGKVSSIPSSPQPFLLPRDSLIIERSCLLPGQLLSASCCKSASRQLVTSFTGHLLHLPAPKGKGWVQTVLPIPWRTQQWKLFFLHTSRRTKKGDNTRDTTLRQPVQNSLWKCHRTLQLLYFQLLENLPIEAEHSVDNVNWETLSLLIFHKPLKATISKTRQKKTNPGAEEMAWVQYLWQPKII